MKSHPFALLITASLLFTQAAARAQLVGPGDAVYLDGNQYAMVPADPGLTPRQFTFEAWVYPTVATCNAIFGRGDGANGALTDYIFTVGFDGTNCGVMKVALFSGGAWDSSTNTVTLNTWTHVAVSFDGTNKVF